MTKSVTKDTASVARAAAGDRNSLRSLALGAIVGLGLGGLSVAGWIGTDPLPGNVVARVNGAEIRLAEYQRALALFGSEKRDPVTHHDRALILERMVEEELLVQHGVASGLVRGDPGVRTTVLRAMLTGVMVELEAEASEFAGAGSDLDADGAALAKEKDEANVATRDTLLREYLDHLRDAATIRWAGGGSQP